MYPSTIRVDENRPYNMNDVINWLIQNRGLKEGDVFEDPRTGQPIRYIKSPNGSLGNTNYINTHEEYDGSDRDVRDQHVINDRYTVDYSDQPVDYKVVRNPGAQTGTRGERYYPEFVPLTNQ